jgi:signal transduction histidine kinase
MRAQGIELWLDLAAALPLVPCNDIQIEQVLLNLLRNGVEAVAASAPGQCTLVVTTAVTNSHVEIAVCDSGGGIPEPPADVFAPFYTTKASGLGMGLSISRSIIEAHGGRLWATRNAGRGSTFRFTLPTTAEDALERRSEVG